MLVTPSSKHVNQITKCLLLVASVCFATESQVGDLSHELSDSPAEYKGHPYITVRVVIHRQGDQRLQQSLELRSSAACGKP